MSKEKIKKILDDFRKMESDPFNPYIVTKKTLESILEAILEEEKHQCEGICGLSRGLTCGTTINPKVSEDAEAHRQVCEGWGCGEKRTEQVGEPQECDCECHNIKDGEKIHWDCKCHKPQNCTSKAFGPQYRTEQKEGIIFLVNKEGRYEWGYCNGAWKDLRENDTSKAVEHKCFTEACFKTHQSPQAPKTESWEESFDNKFQEGSLNSTKCIEHGYYATPTEIKDFIRETLRTHQQVGELKCTGSGANHDGCKIHSPYILDDRIVNAVKAERDRILRALPKEWSMKAPEHLPNVSWRGGHNDCLEEVKKIIG